MKLIVFDIDDTLTRSEFQHQLAYINAMKAFGISEINQNWNDYEHHTDSYILKENYERNLNKQFDFSFIPDFENKMTDNILALQEVSEIPGSKKMIEFFIAQDDYAMTFATGSLLKPALVKLDQIQINYHKDLVIGSNEIYEREGIVALAIERAKKHYRVDSFEAIISVGDGIWDLKTARNLGLHFLGIGMKNYADFQQQNCKVHIRDWIDFNLEHIEKELGIQ